MEHIKDILSMAVTREIEAYAFYKQVSEKVSDKEVKKMFKELSEEELGHRDFLEKLKNDPSMMKKIEPPRTDYKVAEATELPTFSIDMKPADAVALAMKKEQQAVEFYRSMAEFSGDSEIKEKFNNLASMELNHKHRLENIFVDIGYPESF
jgi:rubrerythrin